jgi:hypothetical protein
MKYTILDSLLYFDDRLLGPADAIYIDTSQPDFYDGVPDGCIRKKLIVGDYVLVTALGQVVGVEEKRPGDYASSWSSRRLHKQLRRILQACDIGVLALRLPEIVWYQPEDEMLQRHSGNDQGLDLLKWQTQGGLVGILPYGVEDVLVALRRWRAALTPGQHLFSAISGTDKRRPVAESPNAQAFMRLFDYCGPTVGNKLASFFGTVGNALKSPDEEWKSAGASSRIRAQVDILRETCERGTDY